MSRPSRLNLRDTLIGAVAVAFVVAPNYLRNYGYGLDYTNHPWLIWNQGLAIANTGHPSLWLHANGGLGIFQPLFGFYGGSLYAIFGGLSALLGQKPDTVYILSIVLFVAMAYRGLWSLGAQVGVSRLAAHLPPFIFITSAYYVTDIYGRGAWTELAALSALIFGLAYGLLLAREGWTAGRMAWFAFAIIIATGSHNISLLWGTLLTLTIGGAAYFVAGPARIPRHRLLRVLGLAVLATFVNAWFLYVDLFHNKDVMISGTTFNWDFTKMFDTPAAILNPFRVTPVGSTTTALVITAPIFALILAVVIRVRARTVVRDDLALTRRLWWVIAGGFVVLLAMMMMPGGAWNVLPRQLTLIQYPFRLGGWLALMTALLLMLSLRFSARLGSDSRAVVRFGVAALVILTLVQAGDQLFPRNVDAYTSRARSWAFDRGARTPPESFYDPGSYRDHTLPIVYTTDDRTITIPAPEPGTTQLTTTVTLPAGEEPILTNIDAGPWNAKITGPGFKVVGRSTDGRIAIARVAGGPDQATITIKADGGAAQTIAGTLSIIALVGLLGTVATVGVRRRRTGADGAVDASTVTPTGDPVGEAAQLDKV